MSGFIINQQTLNRQPEYYLNKTDGTPGSDIPYD